MTSHDGSTTLTLHSSWHGIVGGYLGGGALLALGALAASRAGWTVLPTIIFIGGLVLLAIAVFDYPIATTFDELGFVRHALARRHRVAYEEVSQLTRTRPRMIGGGNRLGGLVAAVGRRRYLLVDQPESRDEFDALSHLLARAAPGLVDDDLSPTVAGSPTWLYRRRRWGASGANR